MTECPCKQCITYAICKRPHKVTDLIHECYIISNYLNSMERAYAIIKTLVPSYYLETEPDMSCHEGSARAILEAAAQERDWLFKEGL